MLLKLIAFAIAAIPVVLFLRTVLFRRPTRFGRSLGEFKRQLDVAIWLFIVLIGAVGAIAFARLAWTWWTEH